MEEAQFCSATCNNTAALVFSKGTTFYMSVLTILRGASKKDLSVQIS